MDNVFVRADRRAVVPGGDRLSSFGGRAVIEMALIGGAVIGLRCRAVLILAGVTAIFLAGLAGHIGDDQPPLLAILFAFLGAAIAQVAALLVLLLKEGLGGLRSAPA